MEEEDVPRGEAVEEAARILMAAKAKPKRTIRFVHWTGEEQGLLGSEFYASNPLYPLAKTAGAINMDGFRTLKEGERVEFEVTQGPKGLQAANVRKG